MDGFVVCILWSTWYAAYATRTMTTRKREGWSTTQMKIMSTKNMSKNKVCRKSIIRSMSNELNMIFVATFNNDSNQTTALTFEFLT